MNTYIEDIKSLMVNDTIPLAFLQTTHTAYGGTTARFRPLCEQDLNTDTTPMPPDLFKNGDPVQITVSLSTGTTYILFRGVITSIQGVVSSTAVRYTAAKEYSAVSEAQATSRFPVGSLWCPSLNNTKLVQLLTLQKAEARENYKHYWDARGGMNIAKYIAYAIDERSVVNNAKASATRTKLASLIDVENAPLLQVQDSTAAFHIAEKIDNYVAAAIQTRSNYDAFLYILKYFQLTVVPFYDDRNVDIASTVCVLNPWDSFVNCVLRASDMTGFSTVSVNQYGADLTGVIADWIPSEAAETAQSAMKTDGRTRMKEQLYFGIPRNGASVVSGRVTAMMTKEGKYKLTMNGADIDEFVRCQKLQLPDWIAKAGLAIGSTMSAKRQLPSGWTHADTCALYWLRLAYADMFHSGVSATVQVPLTLAVVEHINNLATVYEIRPDEAEGSAMYGMLDEVVITITASPTLETRCVLRLSHVRTKEEQERYAIDDLLYTAH